METKILDEHKPQLVTNVSQITRHEDGFDKFWPTLVIVFVTLYPPEKLKVGYLSIRVLATDLES